jgi:hypothetical protein
MATSFVSYSLPGYIPDWDPLTKSPNIIGRFSKPPSLTAANVTSILNAMGATAISPTAPAVCPLPVSFSPRKLKFSFASKKTIEIPVALRSNLLARAAALKTALVAIFGPLACIQLQGEEWGDLGEDLRPNTVVIAPGPDTRATTGLKDPVYLANYSYRSDGGITSIVSVKMNTDSILVPPAPFSSYNAAISNALGTIFKGGCGTNNTVIPRHFVAKIATTSTSNPVRDMTIPIASAVTANIRASAIEILTVAQTLCLKYVGESDPRFSRFIP